MAPMPGISAPHGDEENNDAELSFQFSVIKLCLKNVYAV